jgi:cadmium resistance protein CadD (predicted permease)
MYSSILIVPVAAGAFVATNLDNLALLAAFLVRYQHRKSIVATAYITGVLILSLGGYGIAHAAEITAVEYLGWLGLVPIGLGVAGVINLFRKDTSAGTDRLDPLGSSKTAFFATLTSQLGNGTDTVLTFGALFADSNPASDLIIALTVAAMAMIFLASARYAVGHPALSSAIERHAQRIIPFILIFVGAYILADTATDLV